MKPISLHKIDDALVILFEDEQGIIMRRWGEKDVYTTVSDGILKSSVTSYKEEALEFNFNLARLRKKWL